MQKIRFYYSLQEEKMKILKLRVSGLPRFKDVLEVDFWAQQRVEPKKSENLYCLFSNIYTNNAVSFVGINASGKTTNLKVISFVLNLLNNKSINSMDNNDILEGMEIDGSVEFDTYFHHGHQLYRLYTLIKKEIDGKEGSEKYVIGKERIWSKDEKKIKTKKGLLEFENADLYMERDNDEAYLMEDVSIMVAFHKKSESKIFMRDMSQWVNFNVLNIMGEFPKELLAFLDPSIESIRFDIKKEKVAIALKFKGKKELILDSPILLDHYLSSGTIKGMGIFMSAIFAFMEGGYLIVDELENHFNREIMATLLRFFMDDKVNKRGATLIFSTHYSEFLDEFERNDAIYITTNKGGITAENLANILKRNDMKKSEAFQSGHLMDTVPAYESYMDLKKAIMKQIKED